MPDQIFVGLKNIILTDFLFFQRLISDIQLYVNAPSLKIKYGKRNKFRKLNLTTKTVKKTTTSLISVINMVIRVIISIRI